MMEAFQLCPHHESGIMRIEDDADFSLSHSRFDYRYCTMFRSLKTIRMSGTVSLTKGVKKGYNPFEMEGGQWKNKSFWNKLQS